MDSLRLPVALLTCAAAAMAGCFHQAAPQPFPEGRWHVNWLTEYDGLQREEWIDGRALIFYNLSREIFFNSDRLVVLQHPSNISFEVDGVFHGLAFHLDDQEVAYVRGGGPLPARANVTLHAGENRLEAVMSPVGRQDNSATAWISITPLDGPGVWS